MAQTRFNNDDLRIKKELEMSSFQGRYFLSTPGPGIDMMFREDPHIRLQKFAANQMNNTHEIENDLMGRNRVLRRYNEEYTKFLPQTSAIHYHTDDTHTSDSRIDLPAWTFRGIDNNMERFESPWINPQANIDIEFSNNIQTRLQEKTRKTKTDDNLDWNVWLP